MPSGHSAQVIKEVCRRACCEPKSDATTETVTIVLYMTFCSTFVDPGHISHLAAFLNVIPLVDTWSINLEGPRLIVQTQMPKCR
jgi:hypothetical protein